MLNFDEGNAFMYDVSFSVHPLLCRYCKATKDKNLSCQTPMKVMHLWVMLLIVYVLRCYIPKCQSTTRVLLICMMLVLVYTLCCEGIAK
jgi:hypothetical protein